jgi:predicted metal-dependent peptidase
MGLNSARDLVPDEEANSPESEAELATEWRERVERGHAGDGAHSMLRGLLADLPKIKTPWEQLLRTQLNRGLSQQRALSWSRPARSYIANHGRMHNGRRMPWEPGWSSNKAVARLAVMIDVSGSIDDELLARFSREIAAITRRQEARTVIIIGDDRIRQVVVFEPGRTDLDGITYPGGGGTDFSPLLEAADGWAPDIGVFFTDLAGPAGYRPNFPVIWAVTKPNAHLAIPFGRKLVLD